MKNKMQYTPIYSEAIEEVLFFFRDSTWKLLDWLWEPEAEDVSAEQIKERIELLIGLTKEQSSIKQFLLDYGFSPAKIRRFSRECGNIDLKRQITFLDSSIPVERLLALFLQDRLSFMGLVLHDSEEDPHYSAVDLLDIPGGVIEITVAELHCGSVWLIVDEIVGPVGFLICGGGFAVVPAPLVDPLQGFRLQTEQVIIPKGQ